jgi:hypothetical protein
MPPEPRIKASRFIRVNILKNRGERKTVKFGTRKEQIAKGRKGRPPTPDRKKIFA